MRIVNLTNNIIVAEKARVANNFFTRLRGLLGTKCLQPGEGLVIRPCNSVHTFGMNYAIDVIFADAENKVLKLVPGLSAGKLAMCRPSKYVVELPAGTIAGTGTEVGDYLSLSAGCR